MMSVQEQILFAAILLLVMLGIGSSLSFGDFRRTLKTPRYLAIGVLSQFFWMPLIAYTLSHVLQLSPHAALALFLVGCTPGGATSNMFSYFARGDVALSVAMTLTSTLAAIVAIPGLVFVYTSRHGMDDVVLMPYDKIGLSLVFLIVPVLCGMLIRSKKRTLAKKIEKFGAIMGIALTGLMLVTWLPKYAQQVASDFGPIHIGILGLGLCGFLFGYLGCILFRAPPKARRTISLETGLQNTALTFAIITISFTNAAEMAWVPLIYGASILQIAATVTLAFRLLS